MMARCLLALLMHKTSADVHWRDLAVRRPDGAFLLEPCSGTAAAGTFTAVLGASGAGKSTLLRALVRAPPRARARRATCARRPRSAACAAATAPPRAGLGALRDADGARDARVRARAARRVARRGGGARGARAADARLPALSRRGVGGGRGGGAAISGGERRRLCVAAELALAQGAPALLAADEPTSGLDSVGAEAVVATLRRHAVDKRCAVVAALHQPSSRVWRQYVDGVVLLAPGGRVAYAGPRDRAAGFARAATGRRLPPFTNPAEWLLELVADEACAEQLCAAAAKARPPPAAPADDEAARPRRAATRRGALRLASTGGLGAFLARRYGGGAPALSASGCADRVALLSFSAISMCVLPLTRALDLFGKERKVVAREVERGAYGGGEYVLAKALAEVPSDALFAALHGWALGRATAGGVRSAPAAPLALAAAASATLGLAVGAATPSSDAALAAGMPLVVIHMLTGIVNPGGEAPSERPKPLAALTHQEWAASRS
ncbi:ATPase [Aureococcus anophagefferens]|nr:ATPase [Aureococcus anophagefferens]